jgi:hypothetical protein
VLRANFPSYYSDVPHNEYVRLLTDTGAIGIGLFATALIIWLFVALSAARGRERIVREFALPAIGVLIAWGIVSITDNSLDYYSAITQYAGFLTAGAVVAASLNTKKEWISSTSTTT